MPKSPQQKVKKPTAAIWGQHEVEEVFTRVARYTRMVFLGKWALVGVAALLLLAMMLWPILSSDGSGVRVSFTAETEGDKASANDAPVMQNPRFQGNDAKGRPYLVTADRAIQHTPILATMQNVKAQLTLQATDKSADSNLIMNAQSGEFHDDSKLLYLLGGVVVHHPQGYVVNTPQAAVDTVKALSYGDKQVQVEGPLGKLLATGFEIRDNGDYMRFGFSGRVYVTLNKAVKNKGAQ